MIDAQPPGTVIDHIPASTGQYIGSPGLALLGDGTYVASHDVFGPGSTYDTTRLFRSDDGGRSWEHLGDVEGQFWSNFFAHGKALYLMGTSQQYGDVVIRRSTDGGSTWSSPTDERCGRLLSEGMYHTASVPVVEHEGRLWRAMEDMFPTPVWAQNFRAFVMSAPAESDLLRAESWVSTNRLAGDTGWLDGHFGGWLEGNVVVGPEGSVLDVLRVDYRVGDGEKAALVRVSKDGTSASFDPVDFIEFPGGSKKFTIRFDPETGRYWSLSNLIPDAFKEGDPPKTRNTLGLVSSPDMRSWDLERIVLEHPDVEAHAFQYVEWLFAGRDLIFVSRTAFDDGQGGAHNQHDANYLTFHRIADFRQGREQQP